ncbi:glomulin [Andrena cerasifolii]|uniref:glomulin n=1 Tax=Andrena cerasifolii TaxID=2819439 RepID=UPI00403793E7
MSQVQQNSKSFMNTLADYLTENKFKEALDLFEGDNYDNIIEESSWDIVQIASSYLTHENVDRNEEVVECCTAVLGAIAEKCSPAETILAFLEQIEGPEDDVKFCRILKVLGKSLSRLPDKTKAIEWCVSTIRSYVESLVVPENESQEIATVATNKIRNVYVIIISFLEPLIDEAALENDILKSNAILRDYLLSILIFLMGKPLCHLQEQQLESDLKQPLPERIIMLVSQVTGDMLWFLNVIEERSRKSNSRKKATDEESSNLKVTLFELNENIPDLAYANFYFYVITKVDFWEKVPQVYEPQYIFHACTYLIIKLLQERKNVVVEKGLVLMDHLLGRVTRCSLTSELLQLNVYSELFNVLIKVMVHCDSDKERKKALSMFQDYIDVFDMQARYFIVLRLYQISEHSGLLSLTTGVFKASIMECLQATPPVPHFLGNNFRCLLKLACKLPHGSASDVVELSDEIITSLNLLRFLFLRDKHNQTEIWNLVDGLENDYLKPLREGINLCRAHWKVKMNDLEEQKKTQKISDNIELEKRDAEVALTVGGEKLPAMPVAEKIAFCQQAVNGLDVMESILIRVNECIASNPFKQHNAIVLE